MKRKVLAMILATMACVTAVGCGESSYGNPPDLPYDAGMPDFMKDDLEGHGDNHASEGSASTPSDSSDIVDSPGGASEESIIAEDGTEEAATTEIGEANGIIMLQADWSDLYRPTYTIVAINPENGDFHEVANFWFDSVFERTNPEYTIVPALKFSRYANLYDQFSSDYTKAAATKTFASNGEVHAGWIDSTGSFYDVTEALGEQSQSEFDDLVNYHAVGFQGDTFIYVHSEGYQENQYYGVSLDNITPRSSWEISAGDAQICEEYSAWSWISGYKQTDWIDDDKFLIEANYNLCRIATMSTKSVEEYLPGESSRNNWSAVVSPDRTEVTFLSEAKAGTMGDVGIYIMPLGSDNPTKLETAFVPAFTLSAGSATRGVAPDAKCCYILEWR